VTKADESNMNRKF